MSSRLLRCAFVCVWLTATTIYVCAQPPTLYVQQGPDYIGALALSADSRLLATAGVGTIKLYDLPSGRELRVLRHKDVRALAFSPDGRVLATLGQEEKLARVEDSFGVSMFTEYGARLWDVETGRLLRTTARSFDPLSALAITPDGRNLITCVAGSGELKLYRMDADGEPRAFAGRHRATLLVFAPDGKTMASAGYDHAIKLWDTETGHELRALTGHTDAIRSLAFSADGQTLASGAIDKTTRLWSVATGKPLNAFAEGARVYLVLFAQDSKTLLTLNKNALRRWNTATGQGADIAKQPFYDLNNGIASADGRTIVGAGSEQFIAWDATTGQQSGGFARRADDFCAATFSLDARTLLAESMTRTHVWDYGAGEYRGTVAGVTRCNGFALLSPDYKLAATVDGESIALFDPNTKQLVRRLGPQKSLLNISGLAFSPDSKRLAVSGINNAIKIWDVETARKLADIETRRGAPPPAKVTIAPGVEISAPGSGFPDVLGALAFSPDGKILAGAIMRATNEHVIALWDATTGEQVGQLPGHEDYMSALAFSADGARLISGDASGLIKVWDVSKRVELFVLAGHTGRVTSFAFAPNGLLLSAANDATMRLWDLREQRELVSLVALDTDDWLVATPDGLFDGSPNAWAQILWRFSDKLYDVAPLEWFFNEYFHPNLLADILAGRRPRAPQDIAQKDRRQPTLRLTLADSQTTNGSAGQITNVSASARELKLKIEITEATAGAQDVRLFRNGSLVRVWRGDALKGQARAALEADVKLIAGANRFTAYAFNRDQIKSADAALTVTGAESLRRQGTAYVLAVGVNVYANPDYNLNFAAADAQDFAAEIKRQQEALGAYSRVEVTTLLNAEATKANIKERFAQLARSAQPEDMILIYFAGHGTAQRQQFYLIPHDLGYAGARAKLDAAALSEILAHSISDRELAAAFEQLDAGQLMLIIDACNSGQALDADDERRGPMNSEGLAQLAYEKGMYVLTAAQSFQLANEAKDLGHGYLTAALVDEGLKQAAADAAPPDGAITAREWFDYALRRVPDIFKAEQAKRAAHDPLAKLRGLQLEFSIDELTGQQPRLFYRRELEAQTVVVARR